MWVYLNMETYDLKPIRLSLPTALGNAFFSEFNRAGIQQSIASAISEQTGYELAPQNDEPGCHRNASSSGVDVRPGNALRCG